MIEIIIFLIIHWILAIIWAIISYKRGWIMGRIRLLKCMNKSKITKKRQEIIEATIYEESYPNGYEVFLLNKQIQKVYNEKDKKRKI